MNMLEESDAFQSSSEDEDGPDSDEELQEAFARGELKPGLVVVRKSGKESDKEKKPVINNVPMLELKLEQMKLPKKLDWVERLDMVNGLAPLAPEIALQLDQHKTKRERDIHHINAQRAKSKKNASGQPLLKSADEDPIHNDFVREMSFYRQAQETILKSLPRLKQLGVPTKRPDDYFAEMAKTDNHMQKVAKVLHTKQIATERAEKVRKIRQQKKISKQTQVHVLQERQKAKKEMMESVKKYRKGQKNALDFLDDDNKKGRGGRQTPQGKGGKPGPSRKRQMKDDKYGYGGKKKGSKWNTRESLDGVDKGKNKGRGGGSFNPKGRGGGKGPGFGKRGPVGSGGAPPGRGSFGKRGPGGSGGAPGRGSFGNRGPAGGSNRGPAKRPGKSNRQKIKARK